MRNLTKTTATIILSLLISTSIWGDEDASRQRADDQSPHFQKIETLLLNEVQARGLVELWIQNKLESYTKTIVGQIFLGQDYFYRVGLSKESQCTRMKALNTQTSNGFKCEYFLTTDDLKDDDEGWDILKISVELTIEDNSGIINFKNVTEEPYAV